MALSWWTSFFRTKKQSGSAGKYGSRALCRPCLESLEDRSVPAVVAHGFGLAAEHSIHGVHGGAGTHAVHVSHVPTPASTMARVVPSADPGPPPGTKPPVSPGNGEVPGIPQAGGGSLYYAKDAKLDGFEWFARLHGWFPEVLHSSNAVTPTHQVVDMAYADTGSMTFKNVQVAAAGTYRVTFRYAFASGLFPGVTDREMGLSVNGQVAVNPMHFKITGSFETYRDSSVLVHLNQGTNVISLFNVSEHGVSRVDTMTVTPVIA